jgi:hypothetical protein
MIPINEKEIPIYNKKTLKIILVLMVCGIVTGLLLSGLFIYEANQRIQNMEPNGFFMDEPFPFSPEPLTTSDIIFPSLGVIIVCITTYLLAGLVIVYIKIFLKTNSKYISGLLFFLTPLFIQSIFSVATLRSLFVSSAIPYQHIRESIGFGPGGFGNILVILSIFESIGLSILLYLSNE